jgi:hypothetical protein
MFVTIDCLKLLLKSLVPILISTYSLSVSFAAGEGDEFLLGPVNTVTSRSSGFVSSKTYDRTGRLMEVLLYDLDFTVPPTRYLFEFDATGLLKLETAVEADGSVIYKNRYSYGYDDRGHESAKIATASGGTFSHAEFSIYDSRGNLDSKIYFTGSLFTDKAMFDVYGNLIYGARYKRGSLWFQTLNFFGPDRLLRESRTYDADGRLSSREMPVYDDGRLIKEGSEFFNSRVLQKSEITYEYDAKGNWTKKFLKR